MHIEKEPGSDLCCAECESSGSRSGVNLMRLELKGDWLYLCWRCMKALRRTIQITELQAEGDT